MVAPAREARTLAGERLAAEDADITVRMISIGQPHRAVPLTGAMCLAVASRIEGTVVNRIARPSASPDRSGANRTALGAHRGRRGGQARVVTANIVNGSPKARRFTARRAA